MKTMVIAAVVCAVLAGMASAEVSVLRPQVSGKSVMERLYATLDAARPERPKDGWTRRVIFVEEPGDPLLRKEMAKRIYFRGNWATRMVPSAAVVAVSNEMVRANATPACRRAISSGFEADGSRARMIYVRDCIVGGRGRFDVVFAGDSITHFLSDKQMKAELGENRTFLNLGYKGDTVQNLLYRLENGQLDGYNADLFVVMIGTNNGEKPEDLADGIRHVIEVIRAKHPESKVVLTSLLPRGAGASDGATKRNFAANDLVKGFADGKDVFYIDVTKPYLASDGTVDTAMLGDRLHPTGKGYSAWLAAVKPFVDRYAGRCAAVANPPVALEPLAADTRSDGAGHEVAVCRLSSLGRLGSIDAMAAVVKRLRAAKGGVTLFVNDGCDPVVLQEIRAPIELNSSALMVFPEELDAALKTAFGWAALGPSLRGGSHPEDGHGSYGGNVAAVRACIEKRGAKCRLALVGGDGVRNDAGWNEFQKAFAEAGGLYLAACHDAVPGILWRLENGILDGYTAEKVCLQIQGTPEQAERAKEIVRRKQPQAEVVFLDPKKHYSNDDLLALVTAW